MTPIRSHLSKLATLHPLPSVKLPGSWLTVCAVALLVSACGGGSGSGSASNSPLAGETQLANDANTGGENIPVDGDGPAEPLDTLLEDPTNAGEETDPVAMLDPQTATATYRVTVRNFWSADEYPQDFPGDAHLSFWGGAVHNDAFSLWDFGVAPSPGMEDMAETGRIDILLFDEVAPAIDAGAAYSTIDYRTYTGPMVGDEPGVQEFNIELARDYPLVSMVSMLGPSPDWFVGVDGVSLQAGSEAGTGDWLESVIVSLPLYDGGSKSDIVPTMGGPDIIPPNPISLLTYDVTTGTYLPTDAEHLIGELEFTRIE